MDAGALKLVLPGPARGDGLVLLPSVRMPMIVDRRLVLLRGLLATMLPLLYLAGET